MYNKYFNLFINNLKEIIFENNNKLFNIHISI